MNPDTSMGRPSPMSRVFRVLARLVLALSAGLGPCAQAAGSGKQPPCPPQPSAPTEAQIAAALDQRQDRGFLWELTKDGRTSYLYGTVHIGKFPWVILGPTVEAALNDSEVVALEVDMSSPATGQSGLQGAKNAPRLPANDPLMARLRAQIRIACMPEDAKQQLEKMGSPTLALMALSILAGRREGLEVSYSIDMALDTWGRRLGKNITALETIESQLALFESESVEDLREGLRLGLESLESQATRASLRKVARIWSEGRLDELRSYPEWCDCMKTPGQRELMKRLMDDRNVAMAEKIHTLHEEGRRIFVAVGSLHMVGPAGLPQLMSDRGYEVKRVEFAPAGTQR